MLALDATYYSIRDHSPLWKQRTTWPWRIEAAFGQLILMNKIQMLRRQMQSKIV